MNGFRIRANYSSSNLYWSGEKWDVFENAAFYPTLREAQLEYREHIVYMANPDASVSYEVVND